MHRKRIPLGAITRSSISFVQTGSAFYAEVSIRLPVPCPFSTRKSARSCRAPSCGAPWTLPELSESEIVLIRVSSGFPVVARAMEVAS